MLAWMAIIFTASGDTQSSRHSSTLFEPLLRWLCPWLSQPRVEEIHYLFRKCCHMAEYAILAWLCWRAVRQPQPRDPRPWRWAEAGLALAIVLLYAASDELHQVFVPSRTGQVSDVVVDVGGGVIGLALLWIVGKKSKRW
jgi:VanZ family protein